MKYMGSKRRIAKYILPIILKGRLETQYYVEPFVGGGNLIDKVTGNRIGSDINYYLISTLQALSTTTDWIPKYATEELYYHIRDNKDKYPPHLVGYFGFALSYGGKWFGGWRRDGKGERDYVLESYKNAVKQHKNLVGIEWQYLSYSELIIPENSIIYCDPPYKGTTGYLSDFDHNLFYDWCREKSSEGHNVFVSEYTCPDDFAIVWEKKIVSSLTKDTGSKVGTERLYKV